MKKVLLITSEFPPQPGGIGNHAQNVAYNLLLRGFTVTVFTNYRSVSGMEEDEYDKLLSYRVIRIKRYKINLLTYLKRIYTYLVEKKKYDIIIASGKFPLWMVGLIPTRKRKIAIIHGSEVNLKGRFRKITNNALIRFKKIIAVSNFTKSLIDNLGLENITVIPNGFVINIEKDISKTIHSNPILITVGSVSERKGQINIIKALPKLIELYPKIFYHIVGIPSEKEKLLKLAKRLGVEKYLLFHGQVSEVEKNKLLRESDIFMMLSNSTSSGDVEGFGIAILEANALGLPGIGAKNTGIEDAINNGYSGLTIDAKDTKQVCNAVRSIWDDYINYQNNAMAWSDRFDWKIIINRYINVITK